VQGSPTARSTAIAQRQAAASSNRKDLAFNYLGIGEQKDDPLRLGPTDYLRGNWPRLRNHSTIPTPSAVWNDSE